VAVSITRRERFGIPLPAEVNLCTDLTPIHPGVPGINLSKSDIDVYPCPWLRITGVISFLPHTPLLMKQISAITSQFKALGGGGSMGTGIISWAGLKLTIHLHPVPRLTKRGNITLFPLYIIVACKGKKLLLRSGKGGGVWGGGGVLLVESLMHSAT
jgi:hypothetical protein